MHVIPFPSRRARRAGTGILLFALLLVAWYGTVPAAAAAEGKTWILFSTKPDDEKPTLTDLLIRPNTPTPYYVYVHNPTDNPVEGLTVSVIAGDKTFTSEKLDVPDGKTKRVIFPKLAEGEKVEVLALAGSSFKIRATDPDKNKPLEEKDVAIVSRLPSEYVKVTEISFDSGTADQPNQLTVKVTADKNFSGANCPVKLVLQENAIPGYKSVSKDLPMEGNLTGPGAEAKLVARDIQFRKGMPPTKGKIFVTVDGYARAFVYAVDFARAGKTDAPEEVKEKRLSVDVHPYALAGKPIPVAVEADNLPTAGLVLRLGFDRDNDGKYSEDEIQVFNGDRQRLAQLTPKTTDGGLLFTSKVADWTTSLETQGVTGKHGIKVWAEDKGKEIAKYETAVVLDATPPDPDTIKITSIEKIPGQEMIRVKAVGVDPESGISEVIVFRGEPAANDKIPDGVKKFYATPPTGLDPAWTVQMFWPDTIKEGLVSVQFVNNVGLGTFATKTYKYEPPVEKKTGSIRATVMEGDRLQEGMPVALYVVKDDKVALKDTKKTDKNGVVVFDDLDPGTYKMTSAKEIEGAFKVGEATVTVEAKKNSKAEISLLQR